MRMLRTWDTFPLFDVELTHEDTGQWVYAFVSHLVPLTNKLDGWRHLYQDYQRLERWCFHDGVLGWFCTCHFDNLPMQRWLTALGATPYKMEGERLFFSKKIITDPTVTPASFRAFTRQQARERSIAHG